MKKKYYTVWKGRRTGIFDSWDECKASVEGYVGAEYKSYPTQEQALQALAGAYSDAITPGTKHPITLKKAGINSNIITPSLSVDGAWNTMSGFCEYRGVDTATGEEIFHGGPYADGTNNIVEFLAIVHALSYCKKTQKNLPIYSDSHTAMVWVRAKRANTKLTPTDNNKELRGLIQRAEVWLQENSYTNQIIKWETREWGEIPADFGRK